MSPHPEIAAVLAGERRWCVVTGDCLELMPGMPADCVDVLWSDPPYGHGNADGDLLSRRGAAMGDGRSTLQEPIANDMPDTMRVVVDGMLTEAARILKRCCCCCCCCCCGGGPEPTFAWVANRMDAGGLSFFHSVIWDKRNPGMGWRYRRQHEMVMVAHRKGGKLRWADESVACPNILSFFPPRERVHPNEKPLGLVAKMLKLHALPGDVVFDPFAGSGTTGVAAVQAGCRFIGLELDARHAETARGRVAEAASTLYTPAPAAATQAALMET